MPLMLRSRGAWELVAEVLYTASFFDEIAQVESKLRPSLPPTTTALRKKSRIK